MTQQQSPLVSEFDSPEAEAAYTAWLQQKVQQAQSCAKPLQDHDKVMAEAREVIRQNRRQHAVG